MHKSQGLNALKPVWRLETLAQLCTAGLKRRGQPGATSLRPEVEREMPGGSGRGMGTPVTLKTGGSQVVFNSSTLKSLQRGQRKLATPITIYQDFRLFFVGLSSGFFGLRFPLMRMAVPATERGNQQVEELKIPPAFPCVSRGSARFAPPESCGEAAEVPSASGGTSAARCREEGS